MFCPNCGVESETNRKFCRSCGISLEIISHALAGQLAIQPVSASTESEYSAQSDRQKVKRCGFITTMGGLLLAALLAILGGAFENLDSELGSFIASLAGIGGLVLVTGIGIMIYSLFLPKAASQILPDKQTALPPVQQPVNIQPDNSRMPASSITENTTDLLDTPRAAPKSMNE